MNAGTGPTTTPEELAKWQAGGPGYESTDWLDAVFKKVQVASNILFLLKVVVIR